jgi:quercetin dioxygenase-like cupin family protein
MTTFKLLLSGIFITILFCCGSLYAQEMHHSDEAITWSANQDAIEWVACPEFMPESCRISVLNGNPAEPNPDIFFKLEGNTSVPKHWHHSPERMVLVSGEMEVNYEGQDPEVITPGTYAYGPPELPHSASCISDESCVLFIAFEEPVDAFKAN